MLLTSGPVLAAGAKLGDFVLVEPRGQKGTLSLWLARSRDGDQVLLSVGAVRAQSREARVRERLRLSFEQARTLDHPNLVRVLGVGVEDGQHYVASEFVDGVMLSQLLERSAGGPPVPPFQAAWIAAEITRALAYLENKSSGALALATELTPSSILLTRHGAVKLAELVAAVETQDLVDTAGQDSVGVAAYLSPEVAASGTKDKRSALFGLGAILWELLSGKPLFRRSTELETLAAVRTADIPPLPPHLPPPLLRIVTRCLSRQPDERYPTAAALVEELDAALFGRIGIGPAELVSTVAPLLLGAAPKRKTAMLSDAEQSGRPAPRHEKTVPSEPPFAIADARGPNHTEPSDPPSIAIRAGEVMRTTKPSDPFFDPSRDAGAIVNPRFQVLGRLGAGGMGEVYRVRDEELNEIVALKVIPRNAGNDPQSLERLRREVRLARRISSDHVCRIFDIVDLGNGGRGLTMAMVKGVTLAELMKSGLTIDYRRFARWGAEIADGLAAAHGLSIVHRDLKPENVMIREDDQAVVLDFGIARTSAEVPEPVDGKLTQQGIIMGTPLYMSPEQLHGATATIKSDQFALAASIWEGVLDERPFRGTTIAAIVLAMQKVPEIPKTATPEQRRVLAILQKALDPDPSKRFDDIDGLIAALAEPVKRTGKAAIWIGIGAVVLAVAGTVAVLAATRQPKGPITQPAVGSGSSAAEPPQPITPTRVEVPPEPTGPKPTETLPVKADEAGRDHKGQVRRSEKPTPVAKADAGSAAGSGSARPASTAGSENTYTHLMMRAADRLNFGDGAGCLALLANVPDLPDDELRRVELVKANCRMATGDCVGAAAVIEATGKKLGWDANQIKTTTESADKAYCPIDAPPQTRWPERAQYRLQVAAGLGRSCKVILEIIAKHGIVLPEPKNSWFLETQCLVNANDCAGAKARYLAQLVPKNADPSNLPKIEADTAASFHSTFKKCPP